jgi:pimeloyl-ACP methyl ester carboxylesterase
MASMGSQLGAAAGGSGSTTPSTKRPQLATTVASRTLPTVVLVHGLESSKETWRGVLQYCLAHAMPAVAMDLRGHGESELGDPNSFTSAALADDVWSAAMSVSGNRPVVLVGHSMGGRVVIEAAAAHPNDIAALVIEDIDLNPRSYDWSKTPPVTVSFDAFGPIAAAAMPCAMWPRSLVHT